MASIGHLAAGLACKWTIRPTVSARVVVLLVAASYLPDLDVVAFAFGIPYEHDFGHRGATHSISFAVLLGAAVARWFKGPQAGRLGLAVALACLSHALLDMLTDGGLGVALWWPLSSERVFFPWQPLPVSPIGAGFVSQAGLRVAATELVCLLPLFVLGFWPRPR